MHCGIPDLSSFGWCRISSESIQSLYYTAEIIIVFSLNPSLLLVLAGEIETPKDVHEEKTQIGRPVCLFVCLFVSF